MPTRNVDRSPLVFVYEVDERDNTPALVLRYPAVNEYITLTVERIEQLEKIVAAAKAFGRGP